tara:strand:+ start:1520 stop:2680 length:1161 start_codon:yes stop_codon:yes gene_type:complete
MEVYLVGGAVRDRFLGLPVGEKDWCVVGSSPDELTNLGFKSVGKDFPVFLHPETKEEYALARTEKKTGPGYHGFDFNTSKNITLHEDLERRDLTINAMAIDRNDNLIDPFNGIDDINQKKLRHVSKAFDEDPVRVLRTAKFAARFHHLGFSVHADTQKIMKSISDDGELDHLVSDRIWKEMEQALSGNDPHIFFITLQNCGALIRLFPELYINKDAKIKHGFSALKKIANHSYDPAINFSIFIYDIERAKTSDDDEMQINFQETLDSLKKRLPIPRRFSEVSSIFIKYKNILDQAESLETNSILELLEDSDAFRRTERFNTVLDAYSILNSEKKNQNMFRKIAKIILACNNIQTKKIINDETNPRKIREKISQERIRLISREISKK